MCNCFTEYCFDGPQEAMMKFDKQMKAWLKKLNEVDDDWNLKSFLIIAGFDEKEIPEKINGYIQTYDVRGTDEDKYIDASIVSKKREFNEFWDLILKKHFPEIKYYYFVENPRQHYATTNDLNEVYFALDDYVITHDLEDAPERLQEKYEDLFDLDYAWKEDKLRKTLQEILDSDEEDVSKLIAKAEAECTYAGKARYLSISKVEYRNE